MEICRILGIRLALLTTGAFVFCLMLAAPAEAFKFEQKTGPFFPETFAASPVRQEFDNVRPGETYEFTFSVFNRLNNDVDVRLKTNDAEGSGDPQEVLRIINKAQYGAGSWITFEKEMFHLKSGQKLEQTATITVPQDVGGGSWYGAISASTGGPNADVATSGSGIKTVSTLHIEVFMNVAGKTAVGGRIKSADTTTLSGRGAKSLVPFEVVWENTGNVTDAVSGTVKVKSIFGPDAFTAKFTPAIVLRGGTREYRAVWKQTPWIGIFRPVIQMHGQDGKVREKKLGYIVILPPWYYVVAVLLAAAIPIVMYLRNRKWRRLIMEMYAEEGRGGDYDDEFADDEFADDDEFVDDPY
jgi:hypothetical protein